MQRFLKHENDLIQNICSKLIEFTFCIINYFLYSTIVCVRRVKQLHLTLHPDTTDTSLYNQNRQQMQMWVIAWDEQKIGSTIILEINQISCYINVSDHIFFQIQHEHSKTLELYVLDNLIFYFRYFNVFIFIFICPLLINVDLRTQIFIHTLYIF